MTRHYEMQRKRKLQFRRNNNLPVPQTSYLYENSGSQRKKRRQDERQELHEKQQRQDMEQALEIEQQQEEQQRTEMRQALETNMRRGEWLQHRRREKEPITKISIDEQDTEVHETFTREQWRTWENAWKYEREEEDAWF